MQTKRLAVAELSYPLTCLEMAVEAVTARSMYTASIAIVYLRNRPRQVPE